MARNERTAFRFSKVVKKRFSETRRKKLARQFEDEFKKTGKRFMEKRVGGFDYLYCKVTPKALHICFEEEW